MSPVVGSFVYDLVADPRFADKANDIVVECGNALYQPVLDRYIAGEDVPVADVRKVWRDTTQPSCGFSSFYETLFALVRRVNQTSAKKYERDCPGVTYVVAYHRRFERDNDQLEARMASWPVPSLVPFSGTWLSDLDASYFPDTEEAPPGAHGYPGVDAYLYLGRRDVLLAEQLNIRSLVDQDYLAELDRRADVLGEPADSPMRPAAVLQRAAESGVLLYE